METILRKRAGTIIIKYKDHNNIDDLLGLQTKINTKYDLLRRDTIDRIYKILKKLKSEELKKLIKKNLSTLDI